MKLNDPVEIKRPGRRRVAAVVEGISVDDRGKVRYVLVFAGPVRYPRLIQVPLSWVRLPRRRRETTPDD